MKDGNYMEAILFSPWFVPTKELKDFCDSIGYVSSKYYLNFKLMFDERVINFCKKRTSSLWGEQVYKGERTYSRRCGFAGAGYFRKIDTSKKWVIERNDVDAPIVTYIDVVTNDKGYTSLIKQ